MEDEIQPDVVWEQRVKDVEAEKERRVVTSPGFSFSAAGLLFPYHLGVAQFLIENGYIKVLQLPIFYINLCSYIKFGFFNSVLIFLEHDLLVGEVIVL